MMLYKSISMQSLHSWCSRPTTCYSTIACVPHTHTRFTVCIIYTRIWWSWWWLRPSHASARIQYMYMDYVWMHVLSRVCVCAPARACGFIVSPHASTLPHTHTPLSTTRRAPRPPTESTCAGSPPHRVFPLSPAVHPHFISSSRACSRCFFCLFVCVPFRNRSAFSVSWWRHKPKPMPPCCPGALPFGVRTQRSSISLHPPPMLPSSSSSPTWWCCCSCQRTRMWDSRPGTPAAGCRRLCDSSRRASLPDCNCAFGKWVQSYVVEYNCSANVMDALTCDYLCSRLCSTGIPEVMKILIK